MTPFKRSALLLASALFALSAGATDLTLHYDHAAPDTAQGWEREALPIGNGRIGAMIFGQLAREHIQFNDITLWTGDKSVMGAYQPFGDVWIDLPGHDSGTTNYLRELDIARGIERTSYTRGGVRFQREAFASHPAQAIVMRLTADRPGQYSGSIALTDMHQARLGAAGTRLYATGSLAGYVLPAALRGKDTPPPPSSNVMAYASQVQVSHEGGSVTLDGYSVRFDHCDSITLVIGAGTSYVNDAARQFQGEHPLARVTGQVDAAAARPHGALLAEHEADFGALFDRLAIDLGPAAPARRALPTDVRLAAYTAGGQDPELEAQFFQYGRYLLISSSRDALPANLQGLWNNSLTPPWNSDYHTNINIQMNYWPAETANLSELAQPFFAFVQGVIPVYRAHLAAAAAQALAHGAPAGEESFLSASGQPVRGWTVRTESNPFGAMGYIWNKDRQRLVRPALLGALRLHRRQDLPARGGLSRDEGSVRFLAGPPQDAAGRAPGGAARLVARARTDRGRRDLRPGDHLGPVQQHRGGGRRARHRPRPARPAGRHARPPGQAAGG